MDAPTTSRNTQMMSNGKDILKDLGLQDILIKPDFANFTSWFRELTVANDLSDDEIVKVTELKSAGIFDDDIKSASHRVEEIFGNALTDIHNIEELKDEYDDLKDCEEAMEDMLSSANETDLKIDAQLNQLNSDLHGIEINIESLAQNCRAEAQILEELRIKNVEDRNSFLTSFSGESSPIRWCRLDFDKYCIDSDNASLTVKLLFEKLLKLTSFLDADNQQMKRVYDLQNLETNFVRTALAHFEAESNLKKVDLLNDILSKPFQPMSFSLMSEQTERLTWQNEEIEENIENLESAIKEKIAYLAYQEAKFCETENNKEKLRAAEKRLEVLKKCSSAISDNLIFSEILWLSVHMEKEWAKNILENVSTDYYEKENEQCAENLEILTRLSSNSTADLVVAEFSKQVAGLGCDELSDPVTIYAEWTNICASQLQLAISDSYQITIANSIKDFNNMSAQMNAFIGNGPSDRPNIWNLPILAESEIYKGKFDLMFAASRTMRHDYMVKYHQPFTADELWKRQQLLWIWFLTDPNKFLEVFQITVNGSKKAGTHGPTSVIGGIKRKP